MKRREALKNLGLSLGTITITPTVLGLLQSCQEDLGWNPVFFNKKHIKIISDISDLIIPSDDKVPGSKELNQSTRSARVSFLGKIFSNSSTNGTIVPFRKTFSLSIHRLILPMS